MGNQLLETHDLNHVHLQSSTKLLKRLRVSTLALTSLQLTNERWVELRASRQFGLTQTALGSQTNQPISQSLSLPLPSHGNLPVMTENGPNILVDTLSMAKCKGAKGNLGFSGAVFWPYMKRTTAQNTHRFALRFCSVVPAVPRLSLHFGCVTDERGE